MKTATSSATKGNTRKEVKSRHTIRDKSLASNSRCTPSQVLAFMVEKNESDKRRTIAYERAVAEAIKCKKANIAQVCRNASERFNLEVKSDTVHKIILRGGSSICRPGPKEKFTDEEMEALEVALLSFLALSQANCHEEVSRDQAISIIQGMIQNVSQQRTLKDAGSFYRCVQRRLAAFCNLLKRQ